MIRALLFSLPGDSHDQLETVPEGRVPVVLCSAVPAGLSSPGLCQINVIVPAGLGKGDVPLVASVGGAQTPSTVVISVQ
jgi:uncharacterized protein (TIGR03437 family)